MNSSTLDILGSEELQSAIKEAEGFLSPISKAPGTVSIDGGKDGDGAIIGRLAQGLNLPADGRDKPPQTPVVEHALTLLSQINSSLTTYEASGNKALGFQLQPSQQKTIATLLDIVVFEGIRPNLSPGVGLPSERRPLHNAAAGREGAKAGVGRNLQLLGTSLNGLKKLVYSSSAGLKEMILRRCATDIISGSAELAFNTEASDSGNGFLIFLDSIPTATVLPLTTSLISPTTPPWFQKRLTGYMSLVPMRRANGVKSVIEFIVDTKPGSQPQNRDLVHLRRLLTSMPESISDQDAYFSVVVPQLLSLLDVTASESSIANVAAYVLGGIVYRWKDVGEKHVLRPIVGCLVPQAGVAAASADEEGYMYSIKAIVPEESVHEALSRISALISFPNRNVVSSVLKPVILSLWAIATFALSTNKANWKTRAVGLLETYFKVCGTPTEWDWLLENLLYDGEPIWKFDHGSGGGIEIRARHALQDTAILRLEDVDERISLFSDLMKSQNSDSKGDVLLRVLERWLRGRSERSEDEDPVLLLKDAKVLQVMLEDGVEHIGKKVPQVLRLVEQLIQHYTGILGRTDARRSQLATPSLQNLSRISEVASADAVRDDEIDEEALTIALNLLSTVVANLEQLSSEDEKRRLHNLVEPLQKIARHRLSSKAMGNLALNLSMVLSADWGVSSDNGGQAGTDSKEGDGAAEPTDADTYAKALEYLRDPLVPVRAHGIHLLKDLIVKRSPLLHIPETVDLLLSVIPENDSFVYLNCISCLSALSERHPKTVLEKLLSNYVDRDRELSNDERLRIGEVLLRFVQRQARAITTDLAQELGSTLVQVASRREQMYLEPQQEKKNSQIKDEIEDADVADAAVEARGAEIRMRASALSILGVLTETNLDNLSRAIIRDSLELGLHVLKLERGEETLVTRRAAVVLILNLFKGATERLGPDYRFVYEKIEELQTVLRYVESTDRDLLVKRNAAAVLESLDAVIAKLIIE